MSIQDKFQKFLTEDHNNGRPLQAAPIGHNSVDNVVDGDVHNVEKPEVVDKLNAYLTSMCLSPAVNPYFTAKRIQDKLAIIGLQFEIPMFVGDSGSAEKPLTQFGGMYGYEHPLGHTFHKEAEVGSLNFPDIYTGDGISHRIGGGLSIKFTWTKFKGLYTIDASLVPGGGAKPTSIKEDELKECKECGKTPCSCKA